MLGDLDRSEELNEKLNDLKRERSQLQLSVSESQQKLREAVGDLSECQMELAREREQKAIVTKELESKTLECIQLKQ